MKGLVRRVGSGERGFTLIELLVVVAILGIIAAVVVLNIGSFIGAGTLQAANTELHQVQTSVVAWMAENPTDTPGGVVGPGATDTSPTGSTKATTVSSYLLNPSTLKGTYSIESDGKVVGTDYPGDVAWSDADGQWIETAST